MAIECKADICRCPPPSSPIKNSFTRGTGRREGGLGAYLTEWLISCNVHVCATKRARPTLKKTLATSKKFRGDDWFFVAKRPLSANAIYLLWSE